MFRKSQKGKVVFMDKHSRVVFRIAVLSIWFFSGSLIFTSINILSHTWDYHFGGETGTLLCIIALVGGSLLYLADTFLIFGVYLPLQSEERYEDVREMIKKMEEKQGKIDTPSGDF